MLKVFEFGVTKTRNETIDLIKFIAPMNLFTLIYEMDRTPQIKITLSLRNFKQHDTNSKIDKLTIIIHSTIAIIFQDRTDPSNVWWRGYVLLYITSFDSLKFHVNNEFPEMFTSSFFDFCFLL